MRQLKGEKAPSSNGSELVSIEAIAATWGVSTKTAENWAEVVYLAFDIVIPKAGEVPKWAAALIDVAKHISQKAHLYFAETHEGRRLKAAELIQKTLRLREEGHFTEFDQFRQGKQNLTQDDDDDLEMIAELAAIARERNAETAGILQHLEAQEDAQIEQVAVFIETSDQRKQSKLARRLATRKRPGLGTGQALDVSFRGLPR